MEFLAPNFGLIFWTMLSLVHLILCVVAVLKLATLPMSYETKFAWLVAILLVPLFGVATFFILRKSGQLKAV